MPGTTPERAGWDTCSDAQMAMTNTECSFAHCARQPASLCPAEDFCAVEGCGTLQNDTDGCMRASCQVDADCADRLRCTSIECAATGYCVSGSDGACPCAVPTICAFAQTCVPEQMVGPSGDWLSLRLEQYVGICETGAACHAVWTFTPDGMLVAQNGGVESGLLSDERFAELVRIVDGPGLRPALRDGPACDEPPSDYTASVTLTLSSGVLVDDVTGCVAGGPEGNVFARLFEFARARQ